MSPATSSFSLGLFHLATKKFNSDFWCGRENVVMNRETKNKIAELCIAEIGKQKEFSKLLESDLKNYEK